MNALKFTACLIAGAFAALPALAAGGNAANGQQVFSKCAMCHSNAKGDGNRIGPNLFGVVGRKAGSVPNFYYSPAMKNAGLVWTDGKLNVYVQSPATVVPGNRMVFAGIASSTDRADLVAYLDTLK